MLRLERKENGLEEKENGDIVNVQGQDIKYRQFRVGDSSVMAG